MTYLTNS